MLLLTVGIVGGWHVWTAPMLQMLAVVAIVAAFEPRHVLTLVVAMAPLFLAPYELWHGVALLEASILVMLLADALGRSSGGRAAAGRAAPAVGDPAGFARLARAISAPRGGPALALALGASAVCVLSLFAVLPAARCWAAGGVDPASFHPWDRLVPIFATLADTLPGGHALLAALLAPVTLGAACFAALRLDARFLRMLLYVLAGSALLALVLGMAEYFGAIDLAPYRPGGIALDTALGRRLLLGPAMHPGWLAQLLVVALPVLVLLWAEFHERGRIVLALALALMLAGGVLTQQRSFLLAVGLMAGALIAARRRARSRSLGSALFGALGLRLSRRAILGGVAFGCLVVAVAEVLGGAPLRWLGATLTAPIDRLADLERALAALVATPFGTGAGLAGHLPEVIFAPTNAPAAAGIEPIRSFWLMRLVELGPVGAAAWLATWMGGLALAWRLALGSADADRRGVAGALGLALVGLFAYSIAHDVRQVRVIELLLALLLGGLLGLWREDHGAAGAGLSSAGRRDDGAPAPASRPARAGALAAAALALALSAGVAQWRASDRTAIFLPRVDASGFVALSIGSNPLFLLPRDFGTISISVESIDVPIRAGDLRGAGLRLGVARPSAESDLLVPGGEAIRYIVRPEADDPRARGRRALSLHLSPPQLAPVPPSEEGATSPAGGQRWYRFRFADYQREPPVAPPDDAPDGGARAASESR